MTIPVSTPNISPHPDYKEENLEGYFVSFANISARKPLKMG